MPRQITIVDATDEEITVDYSELESIESLEDGVEYYDADYVVLMLHDGSEIKLFKSDNTDVEAVLDQVYDTV